MCVQKKNMWHWELFVSYVLHKLIYMKRLNALSSILKKQYKSSYKQYKQYIKGLLVVEISTYNYLDIIM